MRRFLLVALLVLLVIPAAAFAQDDKSLWDLNNPFTVSDLGFQFKFPDGWVSDSTKGIRIAENKEDLKAVIDGDDSTQPAGFSIALDGFPVDQLGLKADATLQDIVDTVVKAANVTVQETVDIPVLTHRSITVIGTDSNKRSGLATLWLQDGIVVVFRLGAPVDMSRQIAYTWGLILSTVQPVNPLELNDVPLDSPNGDFTIGYPKGWFTDETQKPGIVAELEEDLASSAQTPAGVLLAILEPALTDLGKDVKDLNGVASAIKPLLGWDETIIPSEHVILNQQALTFKGKNTQNSEGKDQWAYATVMILDKTAVVILVLFPSEDALNEFTPTYLAMLQSIQSTTDLITK